MDRQFERVINVIGQEGLEILQNKTVLVAGLGGVGSYSCEALIRSGLGTIIMVDSDTVDESNLNRQIEATYKTIGRYKTDVMRERMMEINPEAEIHTRTVFIDSENVEDLFDMHVDYVIDAIDSQEGKLALYGYCQKNNIGIISSMGMARRLDPTKVRITVLNKTEKDPLARMLRYKARQLGLSLNIPVVCSSEMSMPMTTDENGNRILGSMIFVPAAAGLAMAEYVMEQLLRQGGYYG